MKPSDMSNVDRIAIEMGHAGRNAIAYIDEDRNSDRPFKLQTYRPYGYTPDRPVVIVQHGVLRNGDEYRDFWIEAADKHKLLIVALTFSNEIWPGVESYNNGRVFSAGGNPRHIDGWTYALVGNVIRDMIDAEITDGQNVYLFGHSAGGQFVHRLMSSQSHAPFKAVADVYKRQAWNSATSTWPCRWATPPPSSPTPATPQACACAITAASAKPATTAPVRC